MADALTGTRVLVAGGTVAEAAAWRDRLRGAGCADVELVADADDAGERAISARPDAVLALGGVAGAVRRAVDPLELDVGPPVVAVDGAQSADEAFALLALLVERRGLRSRLAELEAVVAAQAVARARELDRVRLDGLRRLALAAEYRDDNTREHTERVALLAARLAQRLGVGDRAVALIRRAAPLHDIGKIAIPDAILLKPGRLTADEFEVVKTHVTVGARILAGGDSELLATAAAIVRSHHERWDGSGYPDGLSGAETPVAARVVAVADAFDILVHERPHKDAWSDDDAAGELRRCAGEHFDPDVVQAFEDLGPRAWRALADPFGLD